MRKKLYLIVALLVALVLTGGVFAYGATSKATTAGSLTMGSGPFADVTAGTGVTWSDNISEDEIGSVGTGELFDVTWDPAYTGDLEITVLLTNADELIEAFQYLNMEIGTGSTGSTIQEVLSLQNAKVSLNVDGTDNVTLLGGSWRTHKVFGPNPDVIPDLWAEVSQVDLD